MGFKERLIQYIYDVHKCGYNKFEKKCEIPIGTVNGIGRGMSTYNLGKIMEACPDLNVRWLILGEGEMQYKVEEEKPQNAIPAEVQAELDELRSLVDQQQKLIAMYIKKMSDGKDI